MKEFFEDFGNMATSDTGITILLIVWGLAVSFIIFFVL